MPERIGMDWSGRDGTGSERSGAAMPERNGLERRGREWTGLDGIGNAGNKEIDT